MSTSALSAWAQATSDAFRITVERAVVEPVKPSGRYWDTIPGGSKNASAEERREAKLIREAVAGLAKAGVKAVVGATGPVALVAVAVTKISAFAIAEVADAIIYPDVTGELYVNGRLLLSLPVVKDTTAPSWAMESAPVELAEGDRIRLVLKDKDIGTKIDDAIGSCHGLVTQEVLQGGEALLGQCTNAALLGAVSLRKAPLPTERSIQPGRHEVQLVELGVLNVKPTNQKSWDPGGTHPDILATIQVGKRSYPCHLVRDALALACSPTNLVIDVSATTRIVVSATDVDKFSNDTIGAAAVAHLVGRPAQTPIPMEVSHGVQYASIQLAPAVPTHVAPLVASEPRSQAASPISPGPVHKLLSRGMVVRAIDPYREEVRQCGDRHGAGKISLEFKIEPSGVLRSIRRVSGSERHERCVVGALGGLRFPATETGATLNYPFVFTVERQ